MSTWNMSLFHFQDTEAAAISGASMWLLRHFFGWRPGLFFPLKSSNLWSLCQCEGDNHGFFRGFGTLFTTVSGWGCWKTERGGPGRGWICANTWHPHGLNRQVFGGNNAHLGRAISVRWENCGFLESIESIENILGYAQTMWWFPSVGFSDSLPVCFL